MTAQFIPPAKPILGDDERKAVDEVIASGMVAQGPQVHAFEDEFSSQVVDGVHCVAVNSGTSALHIGLLASGIGEGDEVIVPSFTFAATGNSVALSGAKPVFADVDPVTFTLEPASIEASITDKTAAIMPVHLYGLPANMAEIVAIATKHGLKIFEDCVSPRCQHRRQACRYFRHLWSFLLLPDQEHDFGRGWHDHHLRPGDRP